MISCAHPMLAIHECKFKVDGVTKTVDTHRFFFDQVFDENDDNATVYKFSLASHISGLAKGGVLTCFAYGQTGSGKTFTMRGVETMAAVDLFAAVGNSGSVFISFFEILGDRIMDLLNGKEQIKTMEDKNGQVQFIGLKEVEMRTPTELMEVLEQGFAARTTQSTINNDESSRSHAICQVIVKDKQGNKKGKLVLVDLAVNYFDLREMKEQLTLKRTIRIERGKVPKSILAC